MFVTFMTIYSYIIILLTEWDIVLHFYSQLLGTCQRHAVAPQWPGCTDRRWITLRLSVRDLILKIQRQFKCVKSWNSFPFFGCQFELINQPAFYSPSGLWWDSSQSSTFVPPSRLKLKDQMPAPLPHLSVILLQTQCYTCLGLRGQHNSNEPWGIVIQMNLQLWHQLWNLIKLSQISIGSQMRS